MRIIETVGAIDIDRCLGGVLISQDNATGDDGGDVYIPDALLETVITALRSVKAE